MSSGPTAIQTAGEDLWQLQFGARPLADGSTRFRIWAPLAESIAVKIVGDSPRTHEMQRLNGDIFEGVVPDLGAGVDYLYVINGEKERPDPVSRWQPQGVHGPSRVVDPDGFAWTDANWRGIPQKDLILYELHTGTFTPEGTFEAIIPKLPYLKELGVNAIELMPVAEFPGGRNWGYDGTYLYAPQSTYGGPLALKRLVDACHREGLAVVMDVVYNHLGPEGNYLGEYAPVFTKHYLTPWGNALNFDDAGSDNVRRLFIDNALYWLTEFHMDGLRLDAVHRIIDISPRHLLADIAEQFRQQAAKLGRTAWTIAESDLNDTRMLKPAKEGGYGVDAQWSDDFHHSLHSVVTGIEHGYFMDFGRVADLARAIREGFVYNGRYSDYRKKTHGTSSAGMPGEHFVVFTQNHDQIANAYWGDRLASVVSVEQQKLAAALLFCTPCLPMLFMGQEWGETAPFLYFTSHTDKELAEAVRKGRKEEYSSFVKEEGQTASAVGGFADPQSVETFEHSKVNWSLPEQSPHAELLRFHKELIARRRELSCLSNCDKDLTDVEFDEERRWLVVKREDAGGTSALLVCNLSANEQRVPTRQTGAEGWSLSLWSGDKKFGGSEELIEPPAQLQGTSEISLSGWNAALYVRR